MSTDHTPRRRFLKQAIAGAALPLAGGFGIPVSLAADGRIVVMGVGGAWGESVKQLIGARFEKQYGIPMALDSRPNAQQVAAIQAMRGKPSVDSVELGGPPLGQAIALGLLDNIPEAAIPNAADVPPLYKSPEMIGWVVLPLVLGFNTKFVKRAEAEAKGWQVLLDPRLKGRVGIPKFGWQGQMWMNAVNLTMGGSYENLDPVMKFCRKVVRDNGGIIVESADQATKLFSSGEVVAAPFFTGRLYDLIDKGAPLDLVYPEGWLPYMTGFCIVKGTPRKDLVEKFIDISLSPDVQEAMSRKFYIPTNAKVATNLRSNARLYIDDATMKRAVKLDFSVIYKHADQNLERYNKEVIS
jgi:putative spermidine/putrescine transport system substrate-binding protein